MTINIKDGKESLLLQLLGADPGIFEHILSTAPLGIVIADLRVMQKDKG